MISYCVVAFRPPYTIALIEDLIRKTSCPYEILVWINTPDDALMELIKTRKAEGASIEVIGITPRNIGMEAFRHLFSAAKYDIITQTDDDVICVSRKIGETATAMFQRHPNVLQIVADCWQDKFTNGARPAMSVYKQLNAYDQLYQGPVDGWFSMVHRSALPIFMEAPFAKYAYLGSWLAGTLDRRAKHGLLSTKFKVLHAVGPFYASLFGVLDMEIEKYKSVGRPELANMYENAKASLPPMAEIDAAKQEAFKALDIFGADL